MIKQYGGSNLEYYNTFNIHNKINARQLRNALNINHLFSTTIADIQHRRLRIHETSRGAKPNTGLYHHIGKKHTMYVNHDLKL